MKTTSKEVITKLQAHILDSFEAENYSVKTPELALTKQINSMRIGNDNSYTTAVRLVEGGQFLIYYYDVNNFMNELNINDKQKDYSDEETWSLYIHLLAREISKIVNAQVYA